MLVVGTTVYCTAAEHLTQLRMHFVEDTTSWVSAKTVWKFMQMRALGIVLNTGTKSIFRTLPYILPVRPLLAQNSCSHANDVLPDFSNVLLNLCQNCKMHFVEDVTGWWTAKTVRKFMQMRAQEKLRKTTPKVYSFVCSMSKTYDNHSVDRTGRFAAVEFLYFMHMRVKTLCRF